MVKRRYSKRKKAPQAKRVYSRKKPKVDRSLANAKKFARFLQEKADAASDEE